MEEHIDLNVVHLDLTAKEVALIATALGAINLLPGSKGQLDTLVAKLHKAALDAVSAQNSGEVIDLTPEEGESGG